MTRKLITRADPVKVRTRQIYATLKRRAGDAETWALEELRAQFDYFMQHGAQCPYCRTRVTHKTVALDHKIPVSRSGLHTTSNLAFCCQSCNKSKGDMTDEEYTTLLKSLDALEVGLRNFTLKSKILTALRISASFRFGADRRARRASGQREGRMSE